MEQNSEKEYEYLFGDERSDFDGLWKEAIERFLPELLMRTLPELYKDIDFSIKPEFLSKELQDSIQRPAIDEHNPPLFVDELIKIFLKNGQTAWILLHIEIQGNGGDDISFRMMLYCSLIFAHHKKMPVALAILTSPRPKKENVGTYYFEQYGTSLNYDYNCFEVYKQSEEELAKSDNPFDLLFLAAKKTMNIRGKNKESKERMKYHYLMEVTKLWDSKGWNERDRRDILTFVARLINLRSKDYIKQYINEVNKLQGENKMKTLSFIEKYFLDEGLRKGIDKGKNIGIQEANFATARRLRQMGMSDDDIHKATELSLEDIRSLDFAEA